MLFGTRNRRDLIPCRCARGLPPRFRRRLRLTPEPATCSMRPWLMPCMAFRFFRFRRAAKPQYPNVIKTCRAKRNSATGGFYKATCNPDVIHGWWDRTENLIGVPMGPRSGVWTVDVDTKQDHDADGIAAWQMLLAENGEINTRTHVTASDGLHVLLIYPADQHIGCGRGSIPKGIEIKGRGGYIVMPPSRRKGRSYTIGSDIDPIDAPAWLIDMISTQPAAPLKSATADHIRLDKLNYKNKIAQRAVRF